MRTTTLTAIHAPLEPICLRPLHVRTGHCFRTNIMRTGRQFSLPLSLFLFVFPAVSLAHLIFQARSKTRLPSHMNPRTTPKLRHHRCGIQASVSAVLSTFCWSTSRKASFTLFDEEDRALFSSRRARTPSSKTELEQSSNLLLNCFRVFLAVILPVIEAGHRGIARDTHSVLQHPTFDMWEAT